jgi:hypothetical protein
MNQFGKIKTSIIFLVHREIKDLRLEKYYDDKENKLYYIW